MDAATFLITAANKSAPLAAVAAQVFKTLGVSDWEAAVGSDDLPIDVRTIVMPVA